MKKLMLNEYNNIKSILGEINTCKAINHENILNYCDYYYDESEKCACLISELCEYGSLSNVVEIMKKEEGFKCIPEIVCEYFVIIYLFICYLLLFLITSTFKIIINMGIGILNGLKYFEENNILHKDIKLANILLCKNMNIKIGFFLSSLLFFFFLFFFSFLIFSFFFFLYLFSFLSLFFLFIYFYIYFFL
jgi:serine/threonine protein kinase